MRPGLGRKRRCHSCPLGRANNAFSKPLAGFESPLRVGRKRGKGKEGRERKETEGMGVKHP